MPPPTVTPAPKRRRLYLSPESDSTASPPAATKSTMGYTPEHSAFLIPTPTSNEPANANTFSAPYETPMAKKPKNTPRKPRLDAEMQEAMKSVRHKDFNMNWLKHDPCDDSDMWKVESTPGDDAIEATAGAADKSDKKPNKGKETPKSEAAIKRAEKKSAAIAAIRDNMPGFENQLASLFQPIQAVEPRNLGGEIQGAVKRKFGGPHGSPGDESDPNDQPAGEGARTDSIVTSKPRPIFIERLPPMKKDQSQDTVKFAGGDPALSDHPTTEGDSVKE